MESEVDQPPSEELPATVNQSETDRLADEPISFIELSNNVQI